MRCPRSILLVLSLMLILAALLSANAGDAPLRDRYGDPLPPGAITRMGTNRFRQGDQVECVAFSPDGTLIAAGNFGLTREVVLWEADTGKKRATIAWEGSPARSVAFSPDGKSLAVGDMEGLIRIWDVNSLRETRLLRGEAGIISSVTFSPDGSRLLSGSSGKSASNAIVIRGQEPPPLKVRPVVCIWDLETGQALLQMTDHTRAVTRVAYAPDGKTIASSSDDKTVRIWNAETGREIAKFEEPNSICALAFNPRGASIAYGTWDSICARNITTGEELWRKPGTAFRLISLAFSPDGETLALCGHFPPARLWDAKTGEEIHLLKGHHDRIYGVAFSPDGKTLASCSDDRTVRLWKTATGEPIVLGEGHEAAISAIAFSPDGKTLLSGGGQDRTLRLWDVATGKQLFKMEGHEHDVANVAISPDGKLLASGSPDRTIRIWDAATGNPLRQMIGISSHLGTLAFSPDGTTLAMGGGYEIGLWNVETGEKIRSLKGHESYVWSNYFSPDGKTLVSSSQDNTIRIWDVASGVQVAQIPPGGSTSSAVFSPDGKLIAAGVSNTLRIFETKTGNEVFQSELRLKYGGFAAFSPDGAILAGAFGLMDVPTRKIILSFPETGSRIGLLAFSPDGKFLATSMADSTILIWDLAVLEKSQHREK